MKILHIPNYYDPHIGGIEQVCKDMVTSLKGEVEQKVICFKDKKGTVINTVDGVEVTRVSCIMKIASQSIAPEYKKELKRIMKSFDPDIIVFHYPNPYVAHYLMKYLRRPIRFILYWHLDITKQKTLGKLFNGQTKKLLERADQIVATSPNYIAGSKWLSKYSSKARVIPNCVSDDFKVITPYVENKIKEIKKENEGKIICMALGRHVAYKGIRYLVEASKYLDDKYVIYIAGTGPESESLKEMAKNDSKIHFLGRVPFEDLKSYVNACDIFTFPSITKNEAFGIALAEAMSAGKPSVTFTIPGSGVNYVNLNGVTGIEVPNRDSKAFAEAIKTLGENEKLRLEYGLKAREREESLFTYSLFKNDVHKLIFDYPKKVVVFNDHWTSGGVESLWCNLLENMKEHKDIEFTILVTQKESTIYDDYLKKINVPIYTLLKRKIRNPIVRTRVGLWVLKHKIRELRPNVIHINSCNASGLKIAKKAKKVGVKNRIVHSHNTNIEHDRFGIKNWAHYHWKGKYRTMPNYYLTCSTEAFNFMFGEDYLDKMYFLKNGVNTDLFDYNLEYRKEIRDRYNISDDTILLGNIGRFCKQKNKMYLLEILKHVTFTNYKLLILGEGELSNEFHKKAEELGLSSHIICPGVDKEVYKYYSAFDYFILPSIHEGLPVVAIEAQCSGVKTLIADTITKEAKVLDSTTYLSLDHPEAWAKELVPYERKSGKEEIIKAGFDIKTEAEKLLDFYRKICK